MIETVVEFFKDFGFIGMFIHSFIVSIIFPYPVFFLQLSLSILHPSSALWLATMVYIACLLGTPIGYFIGKKLGEPVLHKILKGKWIQAATNLFTKNGEAAILIGAFTPIPFKVFTILSGCFNFSFWKLLSYAALGRAVKFYAVGFIFYYYGRSSEGFVMTYLTYIMGGIACMLFIISYMTRKNQQSKPVQVASKAKKLPS